MFHRIQSDCVEADIVLPVGHTAPVSFRLDDDTTVRPYSLPPWDSETCDIDVPAVKWLRGDFFGFPFGVSAGVEHVHGPAANGPWQLAEKSVNQLKLVLDLPEFGGTMEKQVTLREGHRVLYNQHTVAGVEGRFNYGHHPVLEIPEGETALIRTSSFKFGSVYPSNTAPDPTETNVLKSGSCFESLSSVPRSDGGTMSFAEYPSSTKHEDLIMISTVDGIDLGWSAVSFHGYVWLSVRSTAQFPSTLFWLTNGGRSAAPWNGQHDRRIGVEDLCSGFCDGLEISQTEPLSEYGIKSTRLFKADQPTVLRHAQMVVPTLGQKAVQSVTAIPDEQAVRVQFEDGREVDAALDWQWLLEGDKE